MAYLDWTATQIGHETRPQETCDTALTLSLRVPGESLGELVSALSPVVGGSERELRVELAGPSDSSGTKWMLFFKLRESESRVLVAHPDADEWVATVALERAHGERWLTTLRGLEAGQSVALGQLQSLGLVSNLELVITRE